MTTVGNTWGVIFAAFYAESMWVLVPLGRSYAEYSSTRNSLFETAASQVNLQAPSSLSVRRLDSDGVLSATSCGAQMVRDGARSLL